MTPIRVLVADDQVFAVEGLCQIVTSADDMEVVGQASTIVEALELADKTQPDAVVLDIAWPGDREAGIKAIPRIRAKCPDTQIVAVTVYPELVVSARAVGAYALDKSFSKAQLLDAIRWAVETKGTPPVSAEGKEMEPLTLRERNILAEVVKGHTDKQIAYNLHIAQGTVKKHVGSILGKLGATSRTEAAVIAERHRLL